MYDLERKRDEDKKRSEALIHHREERNPAAGKLPDNYHPHWSEKDEETKPRQMLNMGNSYGDVSVAANRRKEMTLTVSEKRRHNSVTLDRDHKRLNGKRRRQVVNPFGWSYTNSANPLEGAFAFKTKKLQPARRVLAQIKRYVDTHGHHTVEFTLPFLSLEKDKNKLQRLRLATREADQEEKERLAREVVEKEHMQRQFLRKLQLSLEKAKQLTGTEELSWWQKVAVTEEQAVSDGEPGAGEDNQDQPAKAVGPKKGRTGRKKQ